MVSFVFPAFDYLILLVPIVLLCLPCVSEALQPSMSDSNPPFSLLAKAWTNDFVTDPQGNKVPHAPSAITLALKRTLPLLSDPTAVPFVCRYRQDTIAPLSNAAVQQLSEYWKTFQSLSSLRERILNALPSQASSLRERVQTSISKTELDDLYAPYKPVAKGSLEDRIRGENPALVDAVDRFWDRGEGRLKYEDENTIILLANRISSHLGVMDALQDYASRTCSVKVSQSPPPKGSSKKNKPKDDGKFRTYYDFECTVSRLRDHQVLAIRRGVDQKALNMKFQLDNDRAESIAQRVLRDRMRTHGKLWKDAIHNAFSRLLRKRCTSRVWKDACSKAEERAVLVFCDNLRSALLAPPLRPASAVLCLDPGFKAGIKVAMVNSEGALVSSKDSTSTVSFIENWEAGRKQLVCLIEGFNRCVAEPWVVALGNGHGSQEARKLVTEALEKVGKPTVPIQLVDEAGASVWSVTQAAADEYPKRPSTALAAISIARRLQNPLAELVKIPPRSLGLGMYQHDFPERLLEEKLQAASIDAVAEVGVDANACSREILEKVPGLTSRMAERIIQARPLQTRQGLLKVSGIGPSTFENCAAFVRVKGREKLDSTLCHPESYELSRYLLEHLDWKLDDPQSVSNVPKGISERRIEWKTVIEQSSKQYNVPQDRVLSVLDQLVRSISSDDPRIDGAGNGARTTTTQAASIVQNCGALPPRLSQLKRLAEACPVRSIKGTVRNVVDFGAFIDFGGESDGLLHRSKLGKVELRALLVGQSIGVDILQVDGNRVSLAVAAGLPPIADSRKRTRDSPKSSSISKRKRKK